MPNSRIPRDIASFVPYMQDTDTYQLLNTNYTRWGWTAQQATDWHNFRLLADSLFAKYINKLKRSTDDTNNLHLLIKDVVEYDQQHNLLDKIAATSVPPAVLLDFETFHIKRGTPLADSTPTRVADGMGVPAIVLKKMNHLVHLLGISDPVHETKGRGEHIKEVQVWRAIIAPVAPSPVPVPVPVLPVPTPSSPADEDYEYVGEALRGTYKSEFKSTDVEKTAWYKARYKNTQGKLGDFSLPLDVVIV